jgi:hypothetical protein
MINKARERGKDTDVEIKVLHTLLQEQDVLAAYDPDLSSAHDMVR